MLQQRAVHLNCGVMPFKWCLTTRAKINKSSQLKWEQLKISENFPYCVYEWETIWFVDRVLSRIWLCICRCAMPRVFRIFILCSWQYTCQWAFLVHVFLINGAFAQPFCGQAGLSFFLLFKINIYILFLIFTANFYVHEFPI